MAVVNINTIKNWFKTGMIPTQAQFWSVFDSYRHKNDNIPVAEVEGINELLATRASQQVLDNHMAQKGAPNGYAPLDEFTKLAAQYLNIVNDLVTGGATALLSAEQGKILQNQVSAINTLLTSDNVNLDTVQELVDAIETVQLSLSSILVNDLTSGGTTKALTAEMGKTLKTLVDGLTSNKLEKGGYAGNAQNLKTEIDDIYQPDVLIRSVPPTRVGDTFTYPAGQYEYLLSKTHHINAANFSATILPATTDYKRTDLIYGKPDNTIAKLAGTESTTVAIRPDVPAGCIGISFINVFGASISDATPVTNEISVQDVFGTQQFSITDYLRIEGVSMDSSRKLISINPLVPLSALLDPINGNDITASIENLKKPFKTIEKLLNSLPITSGETYTIYITGGTVPILRQIKLRNLKFIAYTATTLDFTNCKDADGVTDSFYCYLDGNYRTFTFENNNISIISNYNGRKQLSAVYNGGYERGAVYKGTLNTLNFKSTSEILFGSSNGVNLDSGTDLIIYDCHDSLQQRRTFTVGSGNLRIIKYTTQRKNTITATSGYASAINLQIDSIVEGSVSALALAIQANNLILGNITVNGKVEPRAINTLFSGTVSSGCTIDFIGCTNIKGTLNSTTYCLNGFLFNQVQVFDNFTGKLNNFDANGNGSILLINSNIQTTGNLIRKTMNSNTYHDLIAIKGSCSIISATPSTNLVGVTPIKPATDTSVNLKVEGFLTTNMPSLGANVNVSYNSATFKEKLNEVVIRSKKDLVGKALSSSTTYIIDGIITLLMGEYIEVPVGGLTIVGYGFDVSQINKNVEGQSIFKSPATGGSGNFVTKDIQYNSGLGLVFDIEDSDGSHAIELNDVNFSGCASLGKFKGYRQFTGTTCGVYGCSNGFQLSGTWSGFKFTNSNVISFLTGGTLIRKDTDTIFSNRLYLDLNFSCQVGAKLSDFGASNFTADELFQINNTLCTYNGSKDATTNTAIVLPNITPNDPKARFTNCLGITESAVKFKDLKSPDGNVWRLAVDNAGAIATSSV